MLPRIRSDRLGNISSAYALAVVAAGLAISGVMATSMAFSPNGFPNSGLVVKIGGAALVSALIAVFAIPFTFLLALMPAAAAVLYAETRSIRSPAGYTAMGILASATAFAGLAGYLAWSTGSITRVWSPPATILQLVVGTALVVIPGLCGGLTYWAIAGRYAGEANPSSVLPRSPTPTAQHMNI
jgi:hypothetical protein